MRRPAVLLHHRPEATRLLDRPEVLAHQVLDELEREQLRRRDRPLHDHAGDRRHPGHPGGPPPAFAADDDVERSALVPSHPDRLELAPRPDRLGEPGQGLGLELLARLVGVSIDSVEGDLRGVLRSGDALQAVGRRRGERGRCTVHHRPGLGASHRLRGDPLFRNPRQFLSRSNTGKFRLRYQIPKDGMADLTFASL